MYFFKKLSLLSFTILSMLCLTNTAIADTGTPTYPKTILVVDLNNDGKATYDDFKNGKDGILLFQNKLSPNKEPDNIIESEALLTKIFTDNSLQKSTSANQDKIVDPRSHIYAHIKLMFIDKSNKQNEQLVLMSLKKADIQKIILDGKYISLKPEQRKKMDYIAGKVVLTNGEVRYIHDVAQATP